jgi:hypothetical protein
MAGTILASRRFWEQTGVRLVRTFAQAAGGTLGASATGALSADWKQAMTVGAGAAIIALLMSLEKIEELPADNAEEAAVDAMLAKQGISSGDPLPPLPEASPSPQATTVATSPTSYVPPTTVTTPLPPVSSTSPKFTPVSTPPPPASPAITSGYPSLDDPA